MERIFAKIDLTKINKEKIVPRTFQSKDGEVTAKEYEIEFAPFFNPEKQKVIWENESSELVKVGIVVEKQTKEERQNNVNTPILGDALTFRSKTLSSEVRGQLEQAREAHNKKVDNFNEINPDEIPF